jgi:hypothetical protein
MLGGGHRAGLLLASSAIVWTSAANAAELITYRYDSLGRLTRVERSSTANGAATADYSYDASDNRLQVTVAAPPPAAPLAPSGTPLAPSGALLAASAAPLGPEEPGNRPPVAVSDSGEMANCTSRDFPVLANDRDPDGDSPLALAPVYYSGALGIASSADNRIFFTPNGSGTGTAVISYTVADAHGATATGTLTLDVVQGTCR